MQYSSSMNNKFIELVEGELNSRNWTRADLAKKTGINQSTLSLIFSGDRNPGPEICQAISRGLNMPPELVFRTAGLLPAKPEADEIIERADHIIGSYKYPETKERALAYLEFLRVEEEKGEYRAKPAQHPAPSKP